MISPLAFIDPSAKIGKNVTIMPFAFIDRNVEIGDDCIIMPHVSVMAGTVLGKGNKVHQNTVLGADPQDFKYDGAETGLIIGDNNHIRENVVISRATKQGDASVIGNGNFLMDRVHLCHDVHIGNDNVLGIGVSVAGNSRIDKCVILSSNVVINQGCHIGRFSLAQSGCCVSKNVPPFIIVTGNPAVYHGVNAVVMQNHMNVSERVLRHILNAYRLLSQTGSSVQDALQKIEDQVPKSQEIIDILEFVRNSDKEIIR